MLPSQPPRLAIALISAAALGYEILLMRLFSIAHWHHFAVMIISLALLGYGVSGTFISIAQSWLVRRFNPAFIASAVLFGLTSVGCFLLAQWTPFSTLEILWNPRQWLWLAVIYLMLFVPFFFAANCICLTFRAFRDRISRIYSYDLVGAGIGSLGIIGLLFWVMPMTALKLVGALGMLAGAVAALECKMPRRAVLTLLLSLAAAALLLLPRQPIAISEYKGLSQALRIPGAQVLAERSSPLGLLTVVESPQIPFRHAPGLSLNALVEPPEQLGILTDGDGFQALTRYQGQRESLAFLDGLTSALPYHLLTAPRVLILGTGGGMALLQAEYHWADLVDAVELNPQMSALLSRDFGDYAGWAQLRQRIQLQVDDPRSFIARSTDRYDLIQLDDAGSGHGLRENYLFTTEALRNYLAHLTPGGLLAITLPVQIPPRGGLKLLATAREASADQPDVDQRIAMIRGWKTSTLLIKNGIFSDAEIAALRAFSEDRSFDVVYYPGMPAEQANRYNILPQPYYYQGAIALLGQQRDAFIADYKFNLIPATDDRPYFSQFFRWSTLPELLALRGQGGLTLLEQDYPVLVVTLIQAVIISLLLILAPLGFLKQANEHRQTVKKAAVVSYFGTLGLAFLMIEIAFIQKFSLFLGHPLYAAAVVLAGFLVFAGLGSLYSSRLERRRVLPIVILIGAVAGGYFMLLPNLFAWLLLTPDWLRILIAFALIAPLAFLMGIPFPLGLARLARDASQLIPWAWGINGCASVISAVLAALLAIHFGFTAVVMTAVALYLLAGLSELRLGV